MEDKQPKAVNPRVGFVMCNASNTGKNCYRCHRRMVIPSVGKWLFFCVIGCGESVGPEGRTHSRVRIMQRFCLAY